GWTPRANKNTEAGLVFVFGSRDVLSHNGHLKELRAAYPNARLFGCSTAGEIADTNVRDETIVATAIHFDSTQFRLAEAEIKDARQSAAVGRTLGESLPKEGLVHVLVL